MTIDQSGYVRQALDAYFTRPWLVYWLLKAGLVPPPQDGLIWEPACGIGNIVKVLEKQDYSVVKTDIYDHGYPDIDWVQDFLTFTAVPQGVTTICTNPPYDVRGAAPYPDINAEEFIRHALKLLKPVGGRLFILARHEFECAQGRRDLFPHTGGPFFAKCSLIKRPEWTDTREVRRDASGRRVKDIGPRFNYAWYCFDWAFKGDARFYLLPLETV